jgi:hypothetical protein
MGRGQELPLDFGLQKTVDFLDLIALGDSLEIIRREPALRQPRAHKLR